MKVNILKAPDPALHKVCSDVDLGDPRMRGLAMAVLAPDILRDQRREDK